MSKIIDVRNQMPFGNSTRNISQIKKFVRHHSGTTSGDVFAFLRHWQTLGWKTGGYHEVILRDGSVQLCYNPSQITNGAKNQNNNTYHICVVGNGQFTEAQEKTFNERAEIAMQLFNLQVTDLVGHKELPGQSTACPGISMDIVRYQLGQHINNKNKVGDKEMLDQIKKLEKLIVKLEKQITVQNSNEISPWAKDAQKWVVDNGVSDGSRPRDPVTRQETWAMFYRSAGSPKV